MNEFCPTSFERKIKTTVKCQINSQLSTVSIDITFKVKKNNRICDNLLQKVILCSLNQCF